MTMIKPTKGILFGTLAAALLLAPVACKHKDVPKPRTYPNTATTATTSEIKVPDVDLHPSTKVDPPTDFVKPDADLRATSEDIPSDIEEANRKAQAQGWLQDAFFGYDEATLSAEAQSALQSSASWLKSHPDYRILVEGHCDERGTEQFNLALGDHRAQIVKEYLTTLGVDAGRIRTVSYGEERPFDPGHDEGAWAKNRRGHLVLAGK